MGSYKCYGDHHVGFKRFKSENGNDCIVLYPVSKYSTIPQEISPYLNISKRVEGAYKAGAPPGYAGTLRSRRIANLCPDAEIDVAYKSGAKKLVPYVHCHGYGTSADEHLAIPM